MTYDQFLRPIPLQRLFPQVKTRQRHEHRTKMRRARRTEVLARETLTFERVSPQTDCVIALVLKLTRAAKVGNEEWRVSNDGRRWELISAEVAAGPWEGWVQETGEDGIVTYNLLD